MSHLPGWIRISFVLDIAIAVFIGTLLALLLAFWLEGRMILEALP